MTCENMNCRYRTKDELCINLYENCRIYNLYKKGREEREKHEKEQQRHYELNDIGLVRHCNG